MPLQFKKTKSGRMLWFSAPPGSPPLAGGARGLVEHGPTRTRALPVGGGEPGETQAAGQTTRGLEPNAFL